MLGCKINNIFSSKKFCEYHGTLVIFRSCTVNGLLLPPFFSIFAGHKQKDTDL